ncbi:MAG: hypothetical protein WEC37_04995 [Anaerolineales bacterium]
MLPLTDKKGIASANNHPPNEWTDWARQLHRLKLSGFVAALLESGGAFTTLVAQSLYVSRPMLETWLPTKRMQVLSSMLEDANASSAFARMLRDEVQ